MKLLVLLIKGILQVVPVPFCLFVLLYLCLFEVVFIFKEVLIIFKKYTIGCYLFLAIDISQMK